MLSVPQSTQAIVSGQVPCSSFCLSISLSTTPLADATALQKRILNRSRGPAVWALRAQTDKRLYARQMLQILQNTKNLTLREAMVTGLEIEKMILKEKTQKYAEKAPSAKSREYKLILAVFISLKQSS